MKLSDTRPQTYRIPVESAIKLRLLGVSAKMSMGRLIGLMIDREWEEKGDQLSGLLPIRKADKNVHKVLEKLRMR